MKIKYKAIILLWSLSLGLLFSVNAQETDIINDKELQLSEEDTLFLKYINDFDKSYPFINYYQNFVEWYHPSAILPFFYKLRESEQHKVKIIHIGDSHIQSDFNTGHIRMKMQELFGYGGRGFCFPYQCAGTHATYDYYTKAVGEWTYSRNIQKEPLYDMGITGATIHTTDSLAGFQIIFRSRYKVIKPSFTRIQVYYKNDPKSFSLKLITADSSYIQPTFQEQNRRNYLEYIIPEGIDSLIFSVEKTNAVQNFFECYGVHIDTPEDQGILYSSVGINGAGYHSLLSETLFPMQISQYQPDLVVLDLGANDFYQGGFNKTIMRSNLESIINMIRKNAPNSCILLTNSQDIYNKKYDVSGCVDFSQLTREVAREKNCALYDYFTISGGQYSMIKWQTEKLARKDRVHLTASGYLLKGELFTSALLNSYNEYLTNNIKDSLTVKNFCIDTNLVKVKDTDNLSEDTLATKMIPKMVPKIQKKYHIVKSGQTLSGIASKYRISISKIKALNGLRSDLIRPGQRLIVGKTTIMVPVYTTQPSVQNTNSSTPTSVQSTPTVKPVKPTTSSSDAKKIIYKIRKGDVLGSIANRYGVKVSNLKKWNHLSSDRIVAGKTLIIYRK